MPNVPSDLSLLAFGIPPAREAESAGGMPKVPKGQGLGRLACSALCFYASQWSSTLGRKRSGEVSVHDISESDLIIRRERQNRIMQFFHVEKLVRKCSLL